MNVIKLHNNLQNKIKITRSTLRFLRKWAIIFLGCFISSIFIYKSIPNLIKCYDKYSNLLYVKSTEFLLSKGFIADKIIITGNNQIKNADIIKFIAKNKPILFIDLENLKQNLRTSYARIKNITINRLLPDTLIIKIEEFQPFAIWHHHNTLSLIDYTGHIITDNYHEKNLISIYGNNAILHLSFINTIMNSSSPLSPLVNSFIYVSNRRWNIVFHGGLEVKLPEDNPYNAWNYLNYLYETSNFLLEWKTIDLRIPNKIFIRK